MAPPGDHVARVPALIVHGGAGADPADGPELRAGMREAVLAGWRVLAQDGRALDAVEAAVRVLEDHPRFNAGHGSVLTSDGTVEMDASIMEGDRLACGAVASVSRIANPITLARHVLEDGAHVLLVAEGAHAFARQAGLPECDPGSLITERQRGRLAAHGGGTVGAVALDRHGTVAAATSTGGMVGKRPAGSATVPSLAAGPTPTARWAGFPARAAARPSSGSSSPGARSTISRKPKIPTTPPRSRSTCSSRRGAARAASSWSTGAAASVTPSPRC